MTRMVCADILNVLQGRQAMILVDSHIHKSPDWYEPMGVILFQMERNGVDRAMPVQFTGQTDNRYVIECA